MTKRLWLTVLMAMLVGMDARADLQNVNVGGQLRIRARYWDNMYVDSTREIRIPDFFLPGRPIGPFGAASRYTYDDKGNSRAWVEQNSRINVSADFTDNVKAELDFDDFEIWGDDFRSNYVTGADSRANSSDDVEVIQSYIETDETFGFPLRLRIGRQQLKLGSGWLVGETQSTIDQAFDGVRATYTGDGYAIDGWWTKLAETGAAEEDGDVDFYGLSATCTALEGHEFLVYWLFLRDARSINDTNFVAPLEWLEDVFNLDDYDPTNLHTVGFRAAGSFGPVDYAGEVAYQFGEADSAGALFRPVNFLYGDDGARYSNWAGDLEVGYTFENVRFAPRVYLGGEYFGGEDNRDLSFLEWLNPFDQPDASISFNRLFSSKRYYDIWDESRNASNWWGVRAGVQAHPTEAIKVDFQVGKLGIVDEFDRPITVGLGRFDVPVAPALAFLTDKSGGDIGYVTDLTIEYQYSEDLLFRFIWDHLFASNDVDEGNFTFLNGMEFVAGTDHDDQEYFSFETRIKF